MGIKTEPTDTEESYKAEKKIKTDPTKSTRPSKSKADIEARTTEAMRFFNAVMGIETESTESAEPPGSKTKIKTEPIEPTETPMPEYSGPHIYVVIQGTTDTERIEEYLLTMIKLRERPATACRDPKSAIEEAHRLWTTNFQELYGDPVIHDIFDKFDVGERRYWGLKFIMAPQDHVKLSQACRYGTAWCNVSIYEVKLR